MSTGGTLSSARILRQLYFLRYITIAFVILMLVVAVVGLKINLSIAALCIILLVMTVINLITRSLINSGKQITERTIFIQLLFDILSFSLVMYIAGGATNPFTFYYLIPLAIAATVIPGIRTWCLAVLTIFLYSLLLKFYLPLSYQTHDHLQSLSGDNQFSQHVLGMWLGFLISALLVTWFITYFSRELRRRDQAISEARQRELHDQQMVTLGTLAAGTAHELGTPLASIAVVSGEITEGFDPEKHPDLFENQKILGDQIVRCKEILSVLSDSAGESRADEGFLLSPDTFIDNMMAQWKNSLPGIAFHFESQHSDQLSLLFDKTIFQAVINLLNNAAQASSDPIQIKTRTQQNTLLIEITDNGPGMSDEQIEMAGETSFSGKPDGMGIGLFLAISTLRRSGGGVSFNTVEPQGTCTTIHLPLIS